jgi:hypothetical protein
MNEQINRADWYNPAEAAARLTANSGKKIDSSYVRTLARYGKITVLKLGDRASLYLKRDVDAYVVEGRGDKTNRIKRQNALGKGNKVSQGEESQPAA